CGPPCRPGSLLMWWALCRPSVSHRCWRWPSSAAPSSEPAVSSWPTRAGAWPTGRLSNRPRSCSCNGTACPRSRRTACCACAPCRASAGWAKWRAPWSTARTERPAGAPRWSRRAPNHLSLYQSNKSKVVGMYWCPYDRLTTAGSPARLIFMKLFPLFADLQGRRVLVVGGGEIAARKVQLLLEASADVRVGAPALTPELALLAAQGRIHALQGEFRPDWLDDAWLVVAATNDRAVNAAVSQAAQARRIFSNVVDDAELSSFQVPSIVDRSPLVVAISSSGVAPVLARRMRERIESLFDHSLGSLAALAARYRPRIRERRPDLKQ